MQLPRVGVPLIAVFLAACGGGRTAPATQPSPAAFDPAASDPKALAVADAMLAALGGEAAWAKVKQLRWSVAYARDGKVVGRYSHAWDRWNGRHNYEQIDMPSYDKAMAEGKPDDVSSSVAMYELFDHAGKGFVTFDGVQVDSESRDRLVDSAYKQWQADHYRLTIAYKVKDPGVKLALDGQREPVKGVCSPACDVLKLSFAPEVGTGSWYLAINTTSHLPEIVEYEKPEGRVGFAMTGWAAVGPIKLPSKLDNLGVAETFELSDLEVGEPDDILYIPKVR